MWPYSFVKKAEGFLFFEKEFSWETDISSITLEKIVKTSSLEYFSPASEYGEEEIFKLISYSPSKSCSLDPILTWMLKEHINILLFVIIKGRVPFR